MSLLIQYLVKLSISLAIVWLFYQFVLRKLTFYNSNRWYLAGYTLLSFLIPFINIAPLLENNRISGNEMVQFIPSVHQYTIALEEASQCPVPIWSTHYDKWDWMAFGLILGAGIFFLRFIFRCVSFFNMRRKARLISGDGMKLYQVNDNIIPFSFGNAVFINSELHTEEELQEIIRHEFVHVKQKHTLDIIWSEWLCIINWYNPFAWLLKASIRQNLEFIADSKVLENGVSKKQYQYLLLKVIGNNQFSIAQKFNFSSLKKRIAMMNRLKSAQLHLVKFLFVLPLMAVILISFRKQIGDTLTTNQKNAPVITAPAFVTDSVPAVTEPNEKGYIISIKDNKGNCTVVVKDKNGKEVERLLLTKWNENEKYYEEKYGDIPPPPPPVPPDAPAPPDAPIPSTPPAPPVPVKLPEFVKSIDRNLEYVEVWLKNGKRESYKLTDPSQKAAFEKKYGKLPEPPAPPVPPMPLVPPTKEKEVAMQTAEQEDNRANISNDFEITDKKAVMRLKNGKVEKYDLADPEQRKKFEGKYGRIVNVSENATGVTAPFVVLSSHSGQTTLAALNPLNDEIMVVDPNDIELTGKEEILITITKNATPDQLEIFKKQLKEKGIELQYDNIDYNDGILTSISGRMKSADRHTNFVATDFNKLVLSLVRKGDKTYFKVSVTDSKMVI